MNIIPLEVQAAYISNAMVVDSQAADTYLRRELALALAKKLIDEDIVQMQTNYDMDDQRITVRGKIKVIQE